jgi:hypothetical protein
VGESTNGKDAVAAVDRWGHIGATSVPSVRDNSGHQRSPNAPAQQLFSVSITAPGATPVLSRTEEVNTPPRTNQPNNRCRRCARRHAKDVPYSLAPRLPMAFPAWQRARPTRRHPPRCEPLQPPDQPAAPPPRAAPTSTWRRRVLAAGWVVVVAIVALTGLLAGLVGAIKVQAAEYPLNVELREGCLADPALAEPQAPCPKQAEAILRYPDGRTEVIRGTPQQVQRRVDLAVEEVVAAERRRGVGYLLVAALLVASGIAAVVWKVVRRRPRRARPMDQAGDATGSPAG